MAKRLICDVFRKILELTTLVEMEIVNDAVLEEVELRKNITSMRFDLACAEPVNNNSLPEAIKSKRRSKEDVLSLKVAKTVLESLKSNKGSLKSFTTQVKQSQLLEEYIEHVEKVSDLIALQNETFSTLKNLATRLLSSRLGNRIIYMVPSWLISQVQARIINSGHSLTLLPIHMMMLLSSLACLVNTILTRNFGFVANFPKEKIPSL